MIPRAGRHPVLHLVDHFVPKPSSIVAKEDAKYVHIKVTNTGTKLAPENLRAVQKRTGELVK